jgi:hypothetical protein
MMATKTYAEKLKDPRWQKKRLEILSRDEFSCQKCYDTENTLHVHHKRYNNEYKDPWEYPNELLVTLCESCHAEESAAMKEALKYLCDVFQERFFSDEILMIIKGLEQYSMPHVPGVCASVISFSLYDQSESIRIVDSYFEYLKRKHGGEKTADMPF